MLEICSEGLGKGMVNIDSIRTLHGHNADHIVVWLKKMGRESMSPTEQEVRNCRSILGRGAEFTRLFAGWGTSRQETVDSLVKSV